VWALGLQTGLKKLPHLVCAMKEKPPPKNFPTLIRKNTYKVYLLQVQRTRHLEYINKQNKDHILKKLTCQQGEKDSKQQT
jgi:hypothetical protein